MISMLMNSFAHSERILSILRSSKESHLSRFFNYIYVLAEQVGKIVVNGQGTTAMIYFTHKRLRHDARSFLAFIRFLLFGISWRRILKTHFNNRNVKMVRAYHAEKFGDTNYIYVWFLAGLKKGSYASLVEMIDELRKESSRLGLPIYLETAVDRMVPIYERAGFVCYNRRPVGDQIIWFGKMECHAA